jgi:hypothetical protein
MNAGCDTPTPAPQVYLRIKAAMELAEEARLERDAAHSTTASLRQQLEATQVSGWVEVESPECSPPGLTHTRTPSCATLQARLADATRQLLGGPATDGGLGAAEARARAAAATREAAAADKALQEAQAQVGEVMQLPRFIAAGPASHCAHCTTRALPPNYTRRNHNHNGSWLSCACRLPGWHETRPPSRLS